MESWYETRKIWLFMKSLVCNTLFSQLRKFERQILACFIPSCFIPSVFHHKTIFYFPYMQLKSFSKHFRSQYLLTSCSFTSMCGRLVWYKLWQAQMRLIIWNMSVDNKEQQFVIWHHSSGKIVGFVRNFVAPFYYNIIISRHYQGSLLGPGQKTWFQGK